MRSRFPGRACPVAAGRPRVTAVLEAAQVHETSANLLIQSVLVNFSFILSGLSLGHDSVSLQPGLALDLVSVMLSSTLLINICN